jgi:hypothetical protein
METTITQGLQTKHGRISAYVSIRDNWRKKSPKTTRCARVRRELRALRVLDHPSRATRSSRLMRVGESPPSSLVSRYCARLTKPALRPASRQHGVLDGVLCVLQSADSCAAKVAKDAARSTEQYASEPKIATRERERASLFGELELSIN